jgi:hypothetical protein
MLEAQWNGRERHRLHEPSRHLVRERGAFLALLLARRAHRERGRGGMARGESRSRAREQRRCGARHPEEDLEATKLPLKLLGTATHSDPSLAWAAVQDLKNRNHLVVRVEDRLLEQARVVRIERGRIVLENKGRREELALEEDGAPPGRPARLTGALGPGARRGRPAARWCRSPPKARRR